MLESAKLPTLDFDEATIVNIILVFDNVTKRYYFPEQPELEQKRIVAIQALPRQQYSTTITYDGLQYPTILINTMKDYRVTFYEKGKDAPVIENMPLRSLLVMRKNAPGANARTPGGYLKQFSFRIDTRRSYIDTVSPAFQPYYVPLMFYTKRIKLDRKTYKRG